MSSALELDNKETSPPQANAASLSKEGSPALSLPANARIILAHENVTYCEQSKTLFSQAGWAAKLRRCAGLEDLQETLASDEWDLVITYCNSEYFAPAVITRCVQTLDEQRQPSLIYLDDEHTPATAVEIVRCGFSDYLSQPEADRLVFSAAREIFARRNQRLAATSESVIAEAEARSQLLLDSTTDAIAYASDGMLIHVNQALCELLGFASAEALDLQPLIDLVAPDDFDTARALIKEMNGSKQADMPATELNLLSADGESLQLTLTFDSATHEGEACTQIIFRSEQPAAVAADPVAKSEASPGQPGGAAPAPEAATGIDSAGIVQKIEALEGKGLVGFISLSRLGQIRKAIGFYQNHKLASEIANCIRQNLPESALLGEYLSDNWLFALGDESEALHLAELGATLCNAIDALVGEATGIKDTKFAALGLARFGVADMISAAAIDKAFLQCAEAQQVDGGYRLFAPKIDNAEGRAALKSALELDRLAIKYQPVISLQNQAEQHYQGLIYLRNDAGQEITAKKLLDDLGLEKENIALDYWVIEQGIKALQQGVEENPEIRLALPLTASALVAEDFYGWLESTFDASGLDTKHLAFCIDTDRLQECEQAASLLVARLRSKGFAISLTNVKPEHISFISNLRPDFARIHGQLTTDLGAEPEKNSKEALKALIAEASEQNVQCIASQVSAASELAQLWQTGVPFVQGDYLQPPLSAMNYEFSDIA